MLAFAKWSPNVIATIRVTWYMQSAALVYDCRSDASRAEREIQSHFQDELQQQRWVGASTLLADLCGHSDTLASPRVSPVMWMKPQLTTPLPDNPRFPSHGMSSFSSSFQLLFYAAYWHMLYAAVGICSGICLLSFCLSLCCYRRGVG